MVPSLESLGIDRLSFSERMDLISAIWDTLPAGSPDLPIIQERLKDLKEHPERMLTWDEFQQRLGMK